MPAGQETVGHGTHTKAAVWKEHLETFMNETDLFAWRRGMRRAGLLRAALYLVRPDGYVALADPHAEPGRLRH
jgi:hypothetical protein